MITAGSLSTQSNYEKIFIILICMILSVTFAYTINTIGVILNEMEKDEIELKEKLSHINHFMKLRNINTNLSARIRRYIEYLHKEEKMGSKRGMGVFEHELSTSL